ncbi:MAG: class I SAM-dependent methyltransferase [Candidatus Atribacteria bacterium]|nr:class I SAM-dependent methyltransferase [Candidatus Atribacteria bacterium]
MKNNIKNYTEERCKEILKKTGIEEGQIVLDFGCGGGNYTIPVAKIIGNKGKVYAVDEDGYKLKDLQEKAKSANLHNIKIVRTSGELNFGFKDGAFDVVLLYDIFWYFSLQSPKLSELLKAVYRVLKPDGLISVYPEHIETEKLKQKIEKSGFYLINIFQGKIIHEGRPEQGQILNFRKE